MSGSASQQMNTVQALGPMQRSADTMPVRIALSAGVLMLLAAVAYWPLYLSKSPTTIDNYTHVHAALGVVWLVLLVAHAALARSGNVAGHRLLGRTSMIVAPLFVISSVLLTHYRASHMSVEKFGEHGTGLYWPLIITGLFALAFALGSFWRHVKPVHARFMAATAVLLIDPVVTRILLFYFPPLPFRLQVITFTLICGSLLLMWRSLPGSVPGRQVFARFTLLVVIGFVFFVLVLRTGHTFIAPMAWFRALALT